MECTIHVIKGPEAGTQHKLTGGTSIIGRGAKAHVRLTAPSLSYEHAQIILTADECFLENLSAHGSFINDEKVTGRRHLHNRDQVRLGNDVLLRMEVTGGTESSLLSRRNLIIAGVVTFLILVLVVVFNSPTEKTVPAGQWDRAYKDLEKHLTMRVSGGAVPVEVLAHFRDAWRFEQVRDYKQSQQLWFRLLTLLDRARDTSPPPSTTPAQGAAKRPTTSALFRLLNPNPKEPPLTEEEKDVALRQFVKSRSDFANKQNVQSRFY